MNKLITLLFLLPLFTFGQSKAFPTKTDLTKVYTQAISDFIKSANKKNKTTFDTLYFGNRKNGEPDDFPDITLPKIIENTSIQLISPEAGAKKQKENNKRVYINLIGWVEKDNIEFIFVVFSNGFAHQYDFHIHYSYNEKLKEFKLIDIEFKGPPFGK